VSAGVPLRFLVDHLGWRPVMAFSGAVTGICNMGYMMGSMILQPLMGWVLDRNWKGGVQNGARIYDTGAYHAAFALIVAWSILTIVLIGITKETSCRQMVDDK